MRLFLSSAGLTTTNLLESFISFLEGSFLVSKVRAVYVPTAAFFPDKGAEWWKEDAQVLLRTGIGTLSYLDISNGDPLDRYLEQFRQADLICFGGGNSAYLIDCLRKTRLNEEFAILLQDRLFFGISAGSQVVGPSLVSNGPLFPEEDIYPLEDLSGLNIVPFEVIPHLSAPQYSRVSPENIQEFSRTISHRLYALDDSSAVICLDTEVEVISTGVWHCYN